MAPTVLEELRRLVLPLGRPLYLANQTHRQQRLRAARCRVARAKGEPQDEGVPERRG